MANSVPTKTKEELQEMSGQDKVLNRYILINGGYQKIIMRLCRNDKGIMKDFQEWLTSRHQIHGKS